MTSRMTAGIGSFGVLTGPAVNTRVRPVRESKRVNPTDTVDASDAPRPHDQPPTPAAPQKRLAQERVSTRSEDDAAEGPSEHKTDILI